jgi:hypothetical protein
MDGHCGELEASSCLRIQWRHHDKNAILVGTCDARALLIVDGRIRQSWRLWRDKGSKKVYVSFDVCCNAMIDMTVLQNMLQVKLLLPDGCLFARPSTEAIHWNKGTTARTHELR